MRRHAVLILLGLGACSDSTAETSDSSGGLPVAVTTTFTAAATTTSAAISGAGDSVVAVVTQPATCGKTLDASANANGKTLVVTIALTAPGPQNCSPLFGTTTYRVAAHAVPAGTYNATALYRLVFAGNVTDTTVARATISLP
jgi:hypothetical protein